MTDTLAPALILLPGMDGTGELFQPLLAALDGRFEVIVLRYPSDQPLDYPALESLVRQALPQARPFVVLGESFSGPIAVAIAATNTPLLKGLVLCCTFVRNPRPRLGRLSFLLKLLPLAGAPLAPISKVLLGRFATPALRQALAKAVAQVAPRVMQARLKAVVAVDVSQALAASRVPVLYLRAGQDLLVPASASETVARLRPDAQIVTLDGPHCLLQAAPDQAAQHLTRFLQSVS